MKEALSEMYKGAQDCRDKMGKFIMRNNNIQDYSVSKSVDAFAQKPPSHSYASFLELNVLI